MFAKIAVFSCLLGLSFAGGLSNLNGYGPHSAYSGIDGSLNSYGGLGYGGLNGYGPQGTFNGYAGPNGLGQATSYVSITREISDAPDARFGAVGKSLYGASSPLNGLGPYGAGAYPYGGGYGGSYGAFGADAYGANGWAPGVSGYNGINNSW